MEQHYIGAVPVGVHNFVLRSLHSTFLWRSRLVKSKIGAPLRMSTVALNVTRAPGVNFADSADSPSLSKSESTDCSLPVRLRIYCTQCNILHNRQIMLLSSIAIVSKLSFQTWYIAPRVALTGMTLREASDTAPDRIGWTSNAL